MPPKKDSKKDPKKDAKGGSKGFFFGFNPNVNTAMVLCVRSKMWAVTALGVHLARITFSGSMRQVSGARYALTSEGGAPRKRRTALHVSETAKIPSPKAENAATIDALLASGVDVERIRGLCPRVLKYSPERVRAMMAGLKSIDVDPVKALRRGPRLWAADPERWEARLAVLQEMDLDVPKTITACPEILLRTPDSLRAKTKALHAMGLDAAKVVTHRPTVFGLTEDRIRGTIAYLDSVGLNGIRGRQLFPHYFVLQREYKTAPHRAVHDRRHGPRHR